MPVSVPRRASVALLLLAAATAAALLAAYGTAGLLLRDDAAYLYSGQQLVRGVPPYVSILDAKPPLATLLIAAATRAGQALSAGDLQAVRVGSLLLAVATAGVLAVLVARAVSSAPAGWIAAVVLAGSRGYAQLAASGPNAKVPMLFFQVLALLWAAGQRWFLAGFAGGLAFLCWQPMALLPVLTVALAAAQSAPGRRWRTAATAAAGFALPVAAMALYLLATGAWDDMVNNTVLLAREVEQLRFAEARVVERLFRPLVVIQSNYAGMSAPIVLGLAATALLVARRLRGGWRAFVTRDPLAVAWLAFPVHVLFALVDFQGQADLYPLLPYAALGVGWLLALAADGMAGAADRRWRAAATVALALALAGSAAHDYRYNLDRGVERQARWANAIERRHLHAPGAQLLSIGRPEVLCLLHRTHSNPYIPFYKGVPEVIAALEPGGFDGWLARELDATPAAVVLGPIWSDEAEARVRAALEARGYREETVGEWVVFAREKR